MPPAAATGSGLEDALQALRSVDRAYPVKTDTH